MLDMTKAQATIITNVPVRYTLHKVVDGSVWYKGTSSDTTLDIHLRPNNDAGYYWEDVVLPVQLTTDELLNLEGVTLYAIRCELTNFKIMGV